MALESKSYSKSRGTPKLFFSDSKDKDERATDLIEKYSNTILQPTYDKMLKVSTYGMQLIAPELYEKIVVRGNSGEVIKINWKSLSDIPITAGHPAVPLSTRFFKNIITDPVPVDSSNLLRGLHSNNIKAKEFLSWAPFSNTHSSNTYEVSDIKIYEKKE